MIKQAKQVINNILLSFQTGDGGYSARKLSAFIAVAVGVNITVRFTNFDNLYMVVGIWLCFSLLCLGIVTIEQIIKLKNNSDVSNIQQSNISGS